ncbi:MAG: PIN domain-containing protein [Nanoarchaeota archaeon]
MTKCLDTYALVEINNGNPKFASLLNENIAIADLTFAEFYGQLFRKYDKKTADYWHRKLSVFCKPVNREILLKAVIYRIEHAKEDLSFFDCVGYIFSLENNLRFVTGDKSFKGKESVEFLQ